MILKVLAAEWEAGSGTRCCDCDCDRTSAGHAASLQASEDDTFGSLIRHRSPPYHRHPTWTALRCLAPATSCACQRRLPLPQRTGWFVRMGGSKSFPKATGSVSGAFTSPASQGFAHDGRPQSQIADAIVPRGHIHQKNRPSQVSRQHSISRLPDKAKNADGAFASRPRTGISWNSSIQQMSLSDQTTPARLGSLNIASAAAAAAQFSPSASCWLPLSLSSSLARPPCCTAAGRFLCRKD
ncbi:hypothetical protein QBC34DRAFT_192835 [Podospora aff. communis PSN243]|uniref:Uncharacterized protein n=1 Tax=Podospora aff. communis PSN243 TaxID=3040156 RepID=A0AAV9GZH1_9PEZI|nr:hypothetical protein QBC34DRAFT_192835 [Podospora aff. communis PSN243]